MRNEVSRYRLEPDDIERSGVMIPILVRESTGVAMVDTGARITVIDIEYAHELGLAEDGAHRITGATGAGEYPRFRTDIEVPWLNVTVPSPVGGAPFGPTTFRGTPSSGGMSSSSSRCAWME